MTETAVAGGDQSDDAAPPRLGLPQLSTDPDRMTTSTAPLLLQPFTTAHLPGALRLSQQAGWPHRAEDWGLTLSVSQGVVVEHEGQVMATALCSAFGPVAALNMIIVDAALRGRGLGRKLMDAVIAEAGPREMRLVATRDGLPLYEKLGFVATGAIAQHQGEARAADPGRPVRRGAPFDPAALAAMDGAASGMERAPLLSAIADRGEVFSTAGGFALLRAFGRGHVLGPVVARDAATARALIAAAASALQGRFLRLDLAGQPELGAFAEELGLARVGGGTAMVRSPLATPTPGGFTTFALVSQALG